MPPTSEPQIDESACFRAEFGQNLAIFVINSSLRHTNQSCSADIPTVPSHKDLQCTAIWQPFSTMQVSKRTGTVIELIPEDEHGDFDIPALHSLIKNGSRKPALLAVCHIPTSSGHVYDAAAVGAVARQHGVPYLLDACQSAGQVPLDVQVSMLASYQRLPPP